MCLQDPGYLKTSVGGRYEEFEKLSKRERRWDSGDGIQEIQEMIQEIQEMVRGWQKLGGLGKNLHGRFGGEPAGR